MAGANPKQHISFSELMNWRLCPKFHKLANIDELLPFKGSEYTCFGTACHYAIEKTLEEEAKNPQGFNFDPQKAISLFEEAFIRELKVLFKSRQEKDPQYVPDKKLVYSFQTMGQKICREFYSEIHDYLPGFKFVEVEHELFVPIDEKIDGEEYSFKGFIDFIAEKDGEYHLFDWKTCSWGWDAKKRSSIAKAYQLVLYKYFYAKELGIDPAKVRTHFGLLKRAPGKGSSIEIFEIAAGKRRIKNALDLVHQALLNIQRGQFLHNWTGCQHPDRYEDCPFANTEYCTKRIWSQ